VLDHVFIEPGIARLNGRVEGSHRDAEEFYRQLEGGIVIDEKGLFNEKLQEWEAEFNSFKPPHGGLGGQIPYERLRQKTGITT